jgi:hypothetical protein
MTTLNAPNTEQQGRSKAKQLTRNEKTIGKLTGATDLLGERPAAESNATGQSINRAFGGWIPGGTVGARLDRARGGRVNSKKGGKTVVNVVVGHGGGQPGAAPPVMPPIPPVPPPGAPMMPPRPPMAPPMMGPQGPMGPMGPMGSAGPPVPPGPPPQMRARGGRTGVGAAFAREAGIKHEYTGGGDSGVGRLEKIKAYGKEARRK